jgi:hypothetical protein
LRRRDGRLDLLCSQLGLSGLKVDADAAVESSEGGRRAQAKAE